MSTSSNIKLPKVAIIGMEGSGKTVLATVLAKRMSQLPDRRIYLDPPSKTLQYIEGIWHTLQSGEWPPSTPPGKLFELAWNLCVHDKKYELRLIDAAGQDMRLLFGGDGEEFNNQNMAPDLKKLADYCQEASILLITLNISDFVGEADISRMIENQAALKAALDILSQGDKSVGFIFTQCDQYRSLIDEAGGLEEFCKQNLSFIYNAHIHGKKNAIFGVAAVNDVATQSIDGMVRRVPARNFSSIGLDAVIAWIIDHVEKQDRERKLSRKMKKAYLSGWVNMFDFRGKSTRLEYWMFLLVNIGILCLLTAFLPVLSGSWCVLIFIPVISIFMRRLFDAGQPRGLVMLPIISASLISFLTQLMHCAKYGGCCKRPTRTAARGQQE